MLACGQAQIATCKQHSATWINASHVKQGLHEAVCNAEKTRDAEVFAGAVLTMLTTVDHR